MSVQTSDSIVVLPAQPAETDEVETHPELEPAAPAAAAAVADKPRRARPAWLASATVGAVALIASGALGYDAYAGSRQRDDLYAHLVSTTATLDATRSDLSSAKATAASNKVIADYVAGRWKAGSGVGREADLVCPGFRLGLMAEPKNAQRAFDVIHDGTGTSMPSVFHHRGRLSSDDAAPR